RFADLFGTRLTSAGDGSVLNNAIGRGPGATDSQGRPVYVEALDVADTQLISAAPRSAYLNNVGRFFTPPARAPTAPLPLTAAANGSEIDLTITPDGSGPAATGYNIYRSTRSGGEGLLPYAFNVSGTTFHDTNVLSGQTYYYVVTAINGSGE